MQKLHAAVVWLALALCACQGQPPSSSAPSSSLTSGCPVADGAVSTATMLQRGVIVVQHDSCIGGVRHQLATLTVRRSESAEAFDDYVALVGGLAPGETKALRIFEGYLQMNHDRSLTFTVPDHEYYRGSVETIRPGDERYHALLARVGGLDPGERKMVTREAY